MDRPLCKCHDLPMTQNGGGNWVCSLGKRLRNERYHSSPKGQVVMRRKKLRQACKQRESRIATRRERFFS